MNWKEYINEDKELISEGKGGMAKATKKDFLKFHKGGNLGLVDGGVKLSAKEISAKLKTFDVKKFKLTPVSNPTLDNDGEMQKVRVYKDEIDGHIFFYTENTLDNSKNPDVSWDSIDVYTNIYMVKAK